MARGLNVWEYPAQDGLDVRIARTYAQLQTDFSVRTKIHDHAYITKVLLD